TQGQGLSKRDFEKIVEGARLVADRTNLKRCVSIGHLSPERARRLADAGIQRVHHNVETARSYYPEVTTTVRYEGRTRTIDAVKAGLNGVMMGNFLTTLGAEPADDRAMFEELGLNVARQPDNGADPRPDNRSGWLEGETPTTPIDELVDSQAEASFWDPSTQLRVVKKKRKPPPYPEPPGWGD